MTPIELQQRGMEILVRELGYADAVRFMLQFSRVAGDYTKQRHEMLGKVDIEQLLEAAADRIRNAADQRSGGIHDAR